MSAAEATLFNSALLVEDERSLAIALQIALRKLGIESKHASTLRKRAR